MLVLQESSTYAECDVGHILLVTEMNESIVLNLEYQDQPSVDAT